MPENSLSYFIVVVVACNAGVMLGLAAIVMLVPRRTRRRPAHRAEVAPLRDRLTLVTSRPMAARTRRTSAARAA